jgi:hypothetical protein
LFFDSRSAAIVWMIDTQKNKRNANKMTLTYLIGKQYREQQKTHGGVRNSFDKLSRNLDNSNGKNCHLPGQNIAKDSNLNEKTVRNAAIFSENLEKICENALFFLNCGSLPRVVPP